MAPPSTTAQHHSHSLCSPPPSPPPPNCTDEAPLRRRLEASLRELGCNVPTFHAVRLVDDVVFLLLNELFLYVVGPRLRHADATSLRMGGTSKSTGTGSVERNNNQTVPITPASTPKRHGSHASSINKSVGALTTSPEAVGIDINNVHIRVAQHASSSTWTAQVLYHDTPLISAQSSGDEGAEAARQSFVWLCEEARFLRWELTARMDGLRVAEKSEAKEGRFEAGKKGGGMERNMRSRAMRVKERRVLKIRWRKLGGRTEVCRE